MFSPEFFLSIQLTFFCMEIKMDKFNCLGHDLGNIILFQLFTSDVMVFTGSSKQLYFMFYEHRVVSRQKQRLLRWKQRGHCNSLYTDVYKFVNDVIQHVIDCQS